ncbi:cell wall-binding repeat-containing protein [Bacillus sp. SCS-153A]|uniref:cell wall-binding repeat-containing protein n=1 Tax=Rossellomorea sedimentorum TaxID=3115294 RepID=UPI003905EE6E
MIKIKAAIYLIAFILLLSLMPREAGATPEERLAGENRYETAAILSQVVWPNGAEQVVLARGDDFADALASTPFAAKIKGPVLLTQRGKLPEVTKEEINRLGAKKVWVMGGKNAISNNVISELQQQNLQVERVSGVDRTETALKIARKVGTAQQEAIVVNKKQFPDAIAVGPYAALKGIPILLTDKDKLSHDNKEFLKKVKKTYFIGGKAVLSDGLMEEVPNAERIAGESRYVTSVRIAERFFPYADYPVIATGEYFADGLTGSLLAAKRGQPILLVQHYNVDDSVKRFFYYNNVSNYTVLGGYNAVHQYIYSKLVEGR